RSVAQERVLERMELALVPREAAHRGDGAPAHGGGEDETARRGPAVEEHRARPAHALVAALLDVEDPQRVAQHLEQGEVRRRVDLARAAVDGEVHATAMAAATARVRARRVSTPTRSARYAAETNASEPGSMADRASSAARAS